MALMHAVMGERILVADEASKKLFMDAIPDGLDVAVEVKPLMRRLSESDEV